LLDPVRKIIDAIEPQHIRQTWADNAYVLLYLSYGASIVRWRKAILCLQPSLEYNLDAIEVFYRAWLSRSLHFVDEELLYKDRRVAAWLLNTIHEAVYYSKSRPIADELMANHCLAALEVRISHLYHLLLPDYPRNKKKRQKYRLLARELASFRKTSRLLPPEYQDCLSLFDDGVVLWLQRRGPITDLETTFPRPRKICGPPTSPFPFLSQYVTPGLLATFGFEDTFFHQWGPNLSDAAFRLCTVCEKLLSSEQTFTDESFGPVCLALFPHVLSVVVQQLLGHLSASEPLSITANSNRSMIVMVSLLVGSIDFWRSFIRSRHLLGHNFGDKRDALASWIDTWPHMSALIYTWDEGRKWITTVVDVVLEGIRELTHVCT
jgi:hypothetical protein